MAYTNESTRELRRIFGLEFRGHRDGRVFYSDEQTTWSAEIEDINVASDNVLKKWNAGHYTDRETPDGDAYQDWCGEMHTGQEDYSIYE